MGLAVGAQGPKVIVGDVEEDAMVVATAPAADFHRGGAAVFRIVAIEAAADGVELIEVELFGFAGSMVLRLLPKPTPAHGRRLA